MKKNMSHYDTAVMIANNPAARNTLTLEEQKAFLAEGVRMEAVEIIGDLGNITLDDVVSVATKVQSDTITSTSATCTKLVKQRTHDVAVAAAEMCQKHLDEQQEKFTKKFVGLVETGVDGGYIDAEFVQQYFQAAKNAPEPDIKEDFLKLVIDNT